MLLEADESTRPGSEPAAGQDGIAHAHKPPALTNVLLARVALRPAPVGRYLGNYKVSHPCLCTLVEALKNRGRRFGDSDTIG